LRSKPELEIAPPAAEQTAPVPPAAEQTAPVPPAAEQTAPVPPANEGAAAPGAGEDAPAAIEPNTEWQTVPNSGGAEQQPDTETSPTAGGAVDAGTLRNSTDVAKSPRQEPDEGDMPTQAQPASLKSDVPALPPGVVIAVEAPAAGGVQPPVPASMPMSLPLPPPDLGPLPLRQAAAEGDARAQYAIALRYAQGEGTAQNLTEAAHWLERAASAGLAPAQYRLAVLYESGQGVTRDLGRARSWYQAAAEKGNVKAMHNLAVSASGREGEGADYALAARWYGEAAAYGLADSQFNLGILAEHGLGTPKNLSEAYKWFALAAKAGDEEAAKRRELVKVQLAPAELATAEQAVAAWTAKVPVAEANAVGEPAEWADSSPTPNTPLVSRAQSLLNKLGYDVGMPDGLMGAKTRDAIKSFERKNGLQETGQVTIPLVAKLERLTS
jgi:localization factor PodJL